VREAVEQRLLPLVTECKHQTVYEGNFESALQDCLFGIHTTLEDKPEFHNICMAAKRFMPEPGIPVFTKTLSDTPSYRLTLVGIHRLMSIPRHDHPKVTGVQLMISGGVRIRHYELAEECKTEAKLVHLECVSEREYSQGDFDVVTPLVGNIHDLIATKSTAVLLSLQAPHAKGTNRAGSFHWKSLEMTIPR
jgi:hypothetical protein